MMPPPQPRRNTSRASSSGLGRKSFLSCTGRACCSVRAEYSRRHRRRRSPGRTLKVSSPEDQILALPKRSPTVAAASVHSQPTAPLRNERRSSHGPPRTEGLEVTDEERLRNIRLAEKAESGRTSKPVVGTSTVAARRAEDAVSARRKRPRRNAGGRGAPRRSGANLSGSAASLFGLQRRLQDNAQALGSWPRTNFSPRGS